jgi:hypothetical protein
LNEKQREQYSNRHSRRMKLFERIFYKRIVAVFRDQFKQAADKIRSSGVDSLDSLFAGNGIAPVIRDMYRIVGLWAAKRETANINRSLREQKAGFGKDEQWIAILMEYFRTELLAKVILPISGETVRRMRELLDKGIAEGWGVDRIAFEFENSDIPVWRARLIVRTELVQAVFKGQQIAKDDTEFETEDTWIAARDFRTRPSHRHADGDTVKPGRKFRIERYKGKKLVGYDLMLGPGDPTAHAENLCNCRCTKVSRAVRDVNGRIVRKRKQSKISVILPGEFVRREPVLTF